MADRNEDEIRVECPFCHGVLVVDRETGVLLHSARPAGDRKEFEDLLAEIAEADRRREDVFRQAFQAERRRGEILEKKFRRAREEASRDEGRPLNPLDLD